MSKEQSSAETELGSLVLPGKENIGKILTELHRGVNPVDVADDILGPFYEIMGQIRRVR